MLDSTVEGPTRIARLRLERKKERKPTRIGGWNARGGWNEKFN